MYGTKNLFLKFHNANPQMISFMQCIDIKMELDINFSICILLLSKNNLELLCALDNSFKIVETIDYSLNIDLSALTKLAYGIVTSSLSVLRNIFNVILCIIILNSTTYTYNSDGTDEPHVLVEQIQ